jgi:hypothetical protein
VSALPDRCLGALPSHLSNVAPERSNSTSTRRACSTPVGGRSAKPRHSARNGARWRPVSVEITYGELRGYRTATLGERLGDRPTIVVELAAGRTLRIASVAQPGIVGQLADRLSERYAV